MERDVIRLVVFKGRKVVAWRTTEVPQETSPTDLEGPSNGNEGRDLSTLRSVLSDLGIKSSGRLRGLLDKVGIRRGRVVMDLSLYTTLMRHLRIPKVRGRYLEPVVISEVLESLPFHKDEVDITWQLEKGEEGQSVFAIALPKQRVDLQVKVVKEAGLIPVAAYSKAAALALSCGVTDGIIVHLGSSETALVLANGGVPQVVHQLEFGSGESTPEQQASTLARAIEQVAGYYQSVDPNERGQSLPVILTGQTVEASLVAQSLVKKLRRQVLPIKPLVSHPSDFPLPEYATNVGLFLADRAVNDRQAPESLTGARPLNLLPERHRPRPIPALQTGVFTLLLLLAIYPMNVIDLVDAKLAEREQLSRQLQSLQKQEQSFNVLLTSHRENNAQLEDANSQIIELEDRLEDLDTDMDILLARLSTITETAPPPGVELSGVAPLGADFSVVGSASSHAEALRYVANLRGNPLFEDARIMRIDGAGGANPDGSNTVSFQIKVFVPQESQPEGDPAD
jgi:hypothetical protein